MKTLEYYMCLPYRLEIVPDEAEGGYVASYPELRGCRTTGESVESAAANAEDAKREWLAAAIEDGCEIPEPQDEYSGQFKLRIPKSLHRDLALHARREGISMNQYCLYLLPKTTRSKTEAQARKPDEGPAFLCGLTKNALPLERRFTHSFSSFRSLLNRLG